MGTRADFYVGKDKTAEWIGSIAWDGYRDGIDDAILKASTEEQFRGAVEAFFKERKDVTRPAQGWPWPWKDSGTSDCSYWFFDGCVWDVHNKYGNGGAKYLPCHEDQPRWGENGADEDEQMAIWLKDRQSVDFPDMTHLQNVTLGNRSGLIVFTA